MKQAKNLTTGANSTAVKNELRTAYNINAVPRLIVDWNFNRYTTPTASNTPSEDTDGFDIEVFPIDSIIEPLRPSKGVAKALVNQALAAEGYNKAKHPRFYSTNRDDVYKYWLSPKTTNSGGIFPNHSDGLTTARPRVTYNEVVQANKIVIKFENTWATPNSYGIHVAASGTSFGGAIAGGNNAVANDGTVTLYYNGTAWVSTKPTTLVTTPISAIELRVNSLKAGRQSDGTVTGYYKNNVWTPTTGGNSNLGVIAIEAHFEQDLTDRLMNVSDTFDFSERSFLYPIGTITTNTADITLSNEDGIFNPENEDSPYFGLIEPNCEFNLEYIFTVDGTEYSVQQFKMYASNWSSTDGTTAVSLEDYSKYLKEIKPRAMMVEDKTSAEIVWRVLDSVGFVDYEIQKEDTEPDNDIRVFWTTGDETVWEVLDELAKATQTAIYIDGYGVLQVRRRNAAFKQDTTMDWNLLGIKDGSNLPDIISWAPSGELEANKITVKYQDTKWKENSLGLPAMSKVWEPDNDILVLNSNALRKSIDNSSTKVFIDQDDVRLWRYEGFFEIDGEIIEYEGKEYVYYTYTKTYASNGQPIYSNPQRQTDIAKSDDDIKKFNKNTPKGHRGQNGFTGGLKIKTRGAWNTEKHNHSVDLDGWNTKMELDSKNGGTTKDDPNGMTHKKSESLMNINTPGIMNNENDYFWVTRGSASGSGYTSYGFRMRFNDDKASSDQVAGIAYQMNGTRENGYYVELRLSKNVDPKAEATVSEICIYSRKGSNYELLDKGAATLIGEKLWYDVDIYHSPTSGNSQTISVWINGQKVSGATTNSSTAQPASSRFGLYARGKTNVDFEYVYATNIVARQPDADFGFYDLKYGGMRSNRWLREFVWSLGSRTSKIPVAESTKEKNKKAGKSFFDEFGPYVHEVRVYEVKFDPNPVRFSYLFNTNDWYSAVVEYNGSPFDARFVLVNMSRERAVLHGEDNLIFAGAQAPVNQVCVVLGQTLEISDEETVKKKNLPAIRSRGEIESELSSPWIQSKSAARDIAQWMSEHWSDSVDEVEVEIFGNPLIELGDIVDVNYPNQDAFPETHKYWVVAVSNEFDAGIKTSLTLRRRRPATTIS